MTNGSASNKIDGNGPYGFYGCTDHNDYNSFIDKLELSVRRKALSPNLEFDVKSMSM